MPQIVRFGEPRWSHHQVPTNLIDVDIPPPRTFEEAPPSCHRDRQLRTVAGSYKITGRRIANRMGTG